MKNYLAKKINQLNLKLMNKNKLLILIIINSLKYKVKLLIKIIIKIITDN